MELFLLIKAKSTKKFYAHEDLEVIFRTMRYEL